MNKAIVSGATGFIGSELVKLLVFNGVDVISLGRKKYDDISINRKNKLSGSTYINIDMENIHNLPGRLKDIEWLPGNSCVFFNLAWGGANRLSDLDVKAQIKNVAWSMSSLEVAHEIGCERFIQVGTMEESFTNIYLSLDHNKSNKYNRHVIYSVAKITAKRALKLKALSLDINFVYAINSHVMGEDDDKDSFLQVTLQKLIKNEDLIFSSGEQIFDVISLKDCALGYYLISKKGISGKDYWIGSGNPQPLRNYVERMYKMFPSKKKLQFGKLPYNDVILDKKDFSTKSLENDTGFKPTMTYEDTVMELYKHLFS